MTPSLTPQPASEYNRLMLKSAALSALLPLSFHIEQENSTRNVEGFVKE